MTQRRRLTAIVLVGLALLLAAGPALAQEPTLHVDPADSPLVIRGVFEGQPASFSGNVRLTASADAAELRLLASDLRHSADASVSIDRANVSIPAGTTLTKGQPRDVRVTVANVSRPGVYAGQLKLLLPGQTEAQALVIPLELRIEAKPKVQPVQAALTFQVARCANTFSCWLARGLLPASVTRDVWPIALENQTLAPVDVTDAAIVMRGEKTGAALGPGDIILSVPHTLPANKVELIDLMIRRDRLPSDKYTGTLRFKLAGSDQPATVNVDLNVRDGPGWAILVALFGIIVGRLARDAGSAEAQKQMRLLPRYYAIKAKAERVLDLAASAYVAGQLAGVKARIDAGKESEDVVGQEIDKVGARIDFLAGLEDLERKLAGLGLDALTAKVKPQIAAARKALIDGNVEEAQKQRAAALAAIEAARADRSMGEREAEALSPSLVAVRASGAGLDRAESAPPPARPGGARWAWLADLLAFLSGGRPLGAELRFWLVRPLLFFVLLIGLTLVGLQTLYVNAGATFGAAGIYDYLGLFLWGLSADVAQRTLQNITGARPQSGAGQTP